MYQGEDNLIQARQTQGKMRFPCDFKSSRQLDDQYQNPNMNNKDHLVGRLTNLAWACPFTFQVIWAWDSVRGSTAAVGHIQLHSSSLRLWQLLFVLSPKPAQDTSLLGEPTIQCFSRPQFRHVFPVLKYICIENEEGHKHSVQLSITAKTWTKTTKVLDG